MNDSISVIYCFPRSGGTLLNQCLLCDSSNVVLSEVNPAGCVKAPEEQAQEWFNVISTAEADELRYNPYLDKIRRIRVQTLKSGKAFCLRDWSGVNFLEKVSPWSGAPSLLLEQRIYLTQEGYRLREVALVRRSAAVYFSIRKNIPELGHLSIKDFATAYRAFMVQIESIKKIHLEELINNKNVVLRKICSRLQLGYASDFENRFHSVQTVTGNNTLLKSSPSASWTTIRRPTAKDSVNVPDGSHDNLFADLDAMAGYAPLP